MNMTAYDVIYHRECTIKYDVKSTRMLVGSLWYSTQIPRILVPVAL